MNPEQTFFGEPQKEGISIPVSDPFNSPETQDKLFKMLSRGESFHLDVEYLINSFKADVIQKLRELHGVQNAHIAERIATEIILMSPIARDLQVILPRFSQYDKHRTTKTKDLLEKAQQAMQNTAERPKITYIPTKLLWTGVDPAHYECISDPLTEARHFLTRAYIKLIDRVMEVAEEQNMAVSWNDGHGELSSPGQMVLTPYFLQRLKSGTAAELWLPDSGELQIPSLDEYMSFSDLVEMVISKGEEDLRAKEESHKKEVIIIEDEDDFGEALSRMQSLNIQLMHQQRQQFVRELRGDLSSFTTLHGQLSDLYPTRNAA